MRKEVSGIFQVQWLRDNRVSVMIDIKSYAGTGPQNDIMRVFGSVWS